MSEGEDAEAAGEVFWGDGVFGFGGVVTEGRGGGGGGGIEGEGGLRGGVEGGRVCGWCYERGRAVRSGISKYSKQECTSSTLTAGKRETGYRKISQAALRH